MAEEQRCNICNGKMDVVRTEVVAGSEYVILKCEKCRHTVARSDR